MNINSKITNSATYFSGSYTEENNYIGSAIDFSGSSSDSAIFYEENNHIDSFIEEENNFKYGILLAISPLICVITIFIMAILNLYIYEPLKDVIIKLKKKYKTKKIEKKLPIYKCKINTFYIKELNKNNFEEVKNQKKNLECSICFEEINIEKFKHKKTDLIFLNCSHVYHTNCLQSWVKTRVDDFINPDCPCCRGEIFAVKQFQNEKISYDSDSYGGYLDEL